MRGTGTDPRCLSADQMHFSAVLCVAVYAIRSKPCAGDGGINREEQITGSAEGQVVNKLDTDCRAFAGVNDRAKMVRSSNYAQHPTVQRGERSSHHALGCQARRHQLHIAAQVSWLDQVAVHLFGVLNGCNFVVIITGGHTVQINPLFRNGDRNSSGRGSNRRRRSYPANCGERVHELAQGFTRIHLDRQIGNGIKRHCPRCKRRSRPRRAVGIIGLYIHRRVGSAYAVAPA